MDVNLLGQKTPTRYFIFNFLLFPSFLLKINAFLMWFEKGEKKLSKRRIQTWVDHVKSNMTRVLPSAPRELTIVFCNVD